MSAELALNARLEGMQIENDRLTQQRDELIDSMHNIIVAYSTLSDDKALLTMLREAQSAIAKAGEL